MSQPSDPDKAAVVETVTNYLQATADRDPEGVVACYLPEEREHELNKLRRDPEQLPKLTDASVSDLKVEEDLAELRISADAGKKHFTKYLVLQRHEEGWLISLELTARRVFGETISTMRGDGGQAK